MYIHTVDVIHGQEPKAAVSLPVRYVWTFCCNHLNGVGYDICVGQHDAFWETSGAGRVHQVCQICLWTDGNLLDTLRRTAEAREVWDFMLRIRISYQKNSIQRQANFRRCFADNLKAGNVRYQSFRFGGFQLRHEFVHGVQEVQRTDHAADS